MIHRITYIPKTIIKTYSYIILIKSRLRNWFRLKLQIRLERFWTSGLVKEDRGMALTLSVLQKITHNLIRCGTTLNSYRDLFYHFTN